MQQEWLSLKILDGSGDSIKTAKRRQSVLISIPKKVVPLAVCRNRIKRLLREALRDPSIPKANQNCFLFRVRSVPTSLNLWVVKEAVHRVINNENYK